MSPTRRIFIAGNGPSLREVDFNDLRGIDWLGMNAAYRYWDKIGIYPTIYSCLDKVVVKSHAAQILRLHAERKVHKFFLVKDILENMPDFPQDERVFFLEDMVNLTAPESEIFKTAFSDKKTTGSWAVRFAIFLGYREIYLSGIDASYVEVIDEAMRTGVGLELKIGSEIAQNPNYFFDDYQKPGDLYQIPNPERHFGNLHMQSFEAMNVDIARLGLDVVIRNTARDSQLHRFGVYEFVPLKEALRSPSLQAIAVPLTIGECRQFVRNLKLWDSPAFLPLRLDSPLMGQIVLHAFFDEEHDEEIVKVVEDAFNSTTRLKKIFARLVITFLAIPKELNSYIRDKNRGDVPRKMGPNLHFLAMMRKCRKYRYTQLIETDCVPAKSDWLTDLNLTCVRQGPFWIAGAHLDEMGAVNRGLALQINGNAIYATGDTHFIEFLDNVFEPALRYLVLEKGDFSLAYDCLVSRLMTLALASSLPRSGVKLDPRLEGYYREVQANLDRFRFVRLYRNISHIDEEFSEDDLLAMLDGECVIVHSRRLSNMITDVFDELNSGVNRDVGSPILRRRMKDTFIKVGKDDIYAFHYYSNLDGCTFDVFDRTNGIIQLAIRPEAMSNTDHNKGAYINFKLAGPSEGTTIRCEVELIGEVDQKVLLRFSSNGGKFVEARQEIAIVPGMSRSTSLAIACQENYSGLRMQIKPLSGLGGRLKIRFSVRDNATTQNWVKAVVETATDDVRLVYDAFRYVICPSTGQAKALQVSSPFTEKSVAPSNQPLVFPPITSTRATHLTGAAFPPGSNPVLPPAAVKAYFNRLLVIDSTPVGHTSATGQLKQTFLGNWPQSCFLQIWETGGKNSSLHSLKLGQSLDQSRVAEISVNKAIELCREFQPDVIYFRPVDSAVLFEVAERVVTEINKPLVIHMMDDWPKRLEFSDSAKFKELDGALRRMLSRASQRLSICQAMSDTYQVRYGGVWYPLANGADLAEFPAKDWPRRPPISRQSPFVIRYMGALADDMTYSSVREIAVAVSALQEACAVRLEIYTMEWCRYKAEQDIGKLPGVSVHPLVEKGRYKQLLAAADALVIAYNFDPESISYIGLSLANKMPECLASGTPVIAYGPLDVATIHYLKESDCAQVVDKRDQGLLITAIQALVEDANLCQRLGERARAHVAAKLSKRIIQKKFNDYLSGCRKEERAMLAAVVGPFTRYQHAHYDETDCISELFKERLYGQMMIDVGAHHGSALVPFLNFDWRIYAFEPDDQNRSQLLERLSKHKNKHLVSIDARCVSNKTQKGVSFFTSEQSTGISGLSAFHETHVEAQKVDIITLEEYFEDKLLPAVDFLKIDTEGHDLFVLQGFPWGRTRPAVIECEFEDTKTVPLGYSFHDLGKFLVDKGYTVYVSEWHPIIRYGIRHDWNRLLRYPCELADPKGWGNLLAFRDPIDEKDLAAALHKVLKVGTVGAEKPNTVDVASAYVPQNVPVVTEFRVEPSPYFAALGANKWRYTHSAVPQKLWRAISDTPGPTADRVFSAGIRLQSDRAMTVNVTLGRHGKTEWEGTTKGIILKPGVAQSVKLNKAFTKAHDALKLQVEVLELEGGGTAMLTIEALHVNESLASIRRRVGETDLTLREANRLFRECDFATAMGIYLLLHRQHSLQIYPDNALMAARKLGMLSVATVEDLLQRVEG